jgi:hypothetical protein
MSRSFAESFGNCKIIALVLLFLLMLARKSSNKKLQKYVDKLAISFPERAFNVWLTKELVHQSLKDRQTFTISLIFSSTATSNSTSQKSFSTKKTKQATTKKAKSKYFYPEKWQQQIQNSLNCVFYPFLLLSSSSSSFHSIVLISLSSSSRFRLLLIIPDDSH